MPTITIEPTAAAVEAGRGAQFTIRVDPTVDDLEGRDVPGPNILTFDRWFAEPRPDMRESLVHEVLRRNVWHLTIHTGPAVSRGVYIFQLAYSYWTVNPAGGRPIPSVAAALGTVTVGHYHRLPTITIKVLDAQ